MAEQRPGPPGPRVLVVAPFSMGAIERSWAGEGWPFLDGLREVLGSTVDFHGAGRAGNERFRTWKGKLAFGWLAPMTTAATAFARARKYDKIVVWYSGKITRVLLTAAVLVPRWVRADICWLGFEMPTTPRSAKQRFSRHLDRLLLRQTDLVICNSRGQLELFGRRFPTAAVKGHYVRYAGPNRVAPSARLMAKEGADGGYVFSGGETNRDYVTLLRAAKDLACKVELVLRDRGRISEPIPPNVTVHENLPAHRFSELLAGAAVVVIPLRDPAVSSGQLVLLQALELGKAVIITEFDGVEDYCVDQENALFLRPGDPNQLRDKLQKLLDDPALRHRLAANAQGLFRSQFQWKSFAGDVASLLKKEPVGPNP